MNFAKVSMFKGFGGGVRNDKVEKSYLYSPKPIYFFPLNLISLMKKPEFNNKN
jgi:hypothetical protein